MLHRKFDEGGCVLDVELGQQVLLVGIHRELAQEYFLRYLGIGSPWLNVLRPGIITPGYFSFMMAQSSTPSMPDMLMSINTTSATGLWLKGKTDMAVYLMGKATAADPYNTDNVNNYASFLTMTSAEEAALPLLQKLNRQFPRNSTILNNIGQAWFGLGDLDKAMKYLDSAVLMFAMHSRISAER